MKIVFGIYKLYLMHHLKIFIQLTRLNRPIGYMLLFWPCSWGLALGYYYIKDPNLYGYYLVLFFLGSLLMRSAGCIVNDLVDKDYDKKVLRTKHRPLASGKISVRRALLYVCVLCLFAFFILIQFNFLTILLGLGSMSLAFSYPFMKRITYWPQLFLGLTFNWGALMAWTAMHNSISYEVIILYLAAIFWTLGYDTIYGAQDMFDDEIIGLKSTAIKFKKNIKLFVILNYSITSVLLVILFIKYIGLNIFSLLLLGFIVSLILQILFFNIKNATSCLNSFKLNNVSGLLLFLSINLIN